MISFRGSMNDPQLDGPDTLPADAPFPATPRIQSLDVLRGFAVVALLTAGVLDGAMEGHPTGPVGRVLAYQLDSTPWVGFRLGDLFTPLFLFMAGVALALSLRGFAVRYGKDASVLRVVRRSFWLYLLGFFCAGGFAVAQNGIPLLGGLQRVALCQGLCGFAYIYCRPRTLVAAGALLLFGYWGLLAFAPVAGIAGSTGLRFDPANNLVQWFDVRLLARIGFSAHRESAGFLTLIPSCAACLVGLGVGRLLSNPLNKTSPGRATKWIALSGLALIAIGGAWSFVFPVIPKLWTSSFVLIASGISALLLAGIHAVAEYRGQNLTRGPLGWLGLNSLAVYVLAQLIDFQQLASRFLGGNIQALMDRVVFAGAGPIAVALLVPVICVLIASVLFRRRLYLRP